MPGESHWRFEPARCPLCGDATAALVGYRGGWAHRSGSGVAVPVVRCRRCGALYPRPRPRPRDMSHYEDPDQYFSGTAGEAAIAAHAVTIAELTEHLGRPGRLLDIGCGCGEALVAAQRAGWEARGIEPVQAYADRARDLYGVEVIVGSHDELIEPDGSFDAVLLSGVLEHVYEPLDLLGRAAKALRPGGVAVIDVPNERSLLLRAANLGYRLRGRRWAVNLSPTFPPFHVVGFGPPSLKAAIRRAGLIPSRVRTYPLSFSAHRADRLGSVAARFDALAARINAGSGLTAWALKPDGSAERARRPTDTGRVLR